VTEGHGPSSWLRLQHEAAAGGSHASRQCDRQGDGTKDSHCVSRGPRQRGLFLGRFNVRQRHPLFIGGECVAIAKIEVIALHRSVRFSLLDLCQPLRPLLGDQVRREALAIIISAAGSNLSSLNNYLRGVKGSEGAVLQAEHSNEVESLDRHKVERSHSAGYFHTLLWCPTRRGNSSDVASEAGSAATIGDRLWRGHLHVFSLSEPLVNRGRDLKLRRLRPFLTRCGA
jgi:hypothetical protein